MTTSAKSELVAENLSCGYGKPVLSHVSFACSPGQVTVVIGRNGSGKSTLLKSLAGLLPPLSGVPRFGDSVASLTDRERANLISFVPQEEDNRFGFSAREIVAMGRIAKSNGLFDTPEDRRIVHAAMERTDCLSFADRPINELSGGERQRVRLARALAQETPCILLDEPTSHLDVSHQLEMVRTMTELAREGRVVVTALHDLHLVGQFADQVLLLGAGGLILSGSAAEVLASKALDQAYGVTFERTEKGGRILILPPLVFSS